MNFDRGNATYVGVSVAWDFGAQTRHRELLDALEANRAVERMRNREERQPVPRRESVLPPVDGREPEPIPDHDHEARWEVLLVSGVLGAIGVVANKGRNAG